MSRIITIGREFGSGGRELGRRIAEELGIEYYDKEIITEIAEHTKLSEEYVRDIIENRTHSLYPITFAHSMIFYQNISLEQTTEVFAAQQKIICDMAEKSDCVIVGRCSDFILRDKKPFRIFVYADKKSRVERCKQRDDGMSAKNDRDFSRQITAIDRRRAEYYRMYADSEWGNKANYDLCVNTAGADIKLLAKSIAEMIKTLEK